RQHRAVGMDPRLAFDRDELVGSKQAIDEALHPCVAKMQPMPGDVEGVAVAAVAQRLAADADVALDDHDRAPVAVLPQRQRRGQTAQPRTRDHDGQSERLGHSDHDSRLREADQGQTGAKRTPPGQPNHPYAHCPKMELQSLGKYRLVSPMPVTDASCRFFLARHSDEPDDEPPSYVVKLLMPGHGPAGVRRRAQFEHETRLLQAFNHASLPTAHAAGEQDGVPYIVMDRIEGTTLGRLLWRRTASPQPLAKEVAIYVLAQLADAVHH